jgi:hypothetical protein
MLVRNYSPIDVEILLAGFYKVGGFIDGSFITISKDVQPYQTTRTSDGQVARTFIKDYTYTVTLRLAATSPANDILSKIYNLDTQTQYMKFPLFVKDARGTSLFLAPTCWIKNVPDLEFSNQVTERTWVLQASQCVTNFGGNAEVSSELETLANLVLGSAGFFV